MENITIPSEADINAIDTDSFVWDDLMDGTLTEATASVVKAVLDQVTASDLVVNIVEQNAGTGKTAKFVLDNVASSANWKIVTTDQFVDTFLTTSEFYDNVGNAANAYKNDTSGSMIIDFDEAGNAIGMRQVDIHNNDEVIRELDLTVDPELIGVNDLVNEPVPSVPNTHLVNSADAPLADSGDFTPDVEILQNWIVSFGFPVAEANGVRLAIVKSLKRLPTNGILILPFFGTPLVNEAYWDAIQALNLTGIMTESEFRCNTEADGSGYWQVAVIKKV
jgi:hypothetical protein